MGITQIYKIPTTVIDDHKKHPAPPQNAFNPQQNIYLWDAYRIDSEGNLSGYATQEDFVADGLSSSSAIYEIALWPSVSVSAVDFAIPAQYVSNVANYNQPDTDLARLIYEQQRPQMIIEGSLDFGNKLVFMTLNNIYEDSDGLEVNPQIPIFLVKSNAPVPDYNGKFINSQLTMERVVSYVSSRDITDAEGNITRTYDQFKFTNASVQPLNARRRRITFKSKPIVWRIDIKGADQNIIPNRRVGDFTDERYQWQEEPFLPIKTDSRVSFSPSWSIEHQFLKLMSDTPAGSIIDRSGSTATIGLEFRGATARASDGFIDSLYETNGYHAFAGSEDYKKYPSITSGAKFPMYNENWVQYTDVGGGSPSDEELMAYFFSHSQDVINYMPILSSTGNKAVITDWQVASATTLPRAREQRNALWDTFKEDSLLFEDIMFFAVAAGAGIFDINGLVLTTPPQLNNEATKSAMYDSPNNLAGDYAPYLESTKRQENIDKLLNGNLTWMGETITTRPAEYITQSFDFSNKPNEWSLPEMKKYLGIYPNKNPIDIDSSIIYGLIKTAPIQATPALDIGIILQGKIFLKYINTINVKAYQMQQDFYINENGEWILEFEYDEAQTITSQDIGYFGGFEIKIEDFINTYEEAKTEGDKYVQYVFENHTYDLPPQIYPAANRKGQPNKAFTKIVYGTGA